MAKYKMHVLVCGGTGCKASQSAQIVENLKAVLAEKGMQDEVQVITTGCFGFCEKGPIVKIMPDNTFYVQVKPEDAEEIIQEHIIQGHKIERLLYKDPKTQNVVSDSKHMESKNKTTSHRWCKVVLLVGQQGLRTRASVFVLLF